MVFKRLGEAMKILIIDDARFQRRQVARMLGEMGHTVLEAENGQEGFMTLCTTGPDVVVCDLLMPVMDGIAFLQMTRKHALPTPVIIVSADVQSSTRAQCLELGAHAFVNKPCQASDLAEALKGLGEQP
jgi:twitching motility two-component system response regulator PilH